MGIIKSPKASAAGACSSGSWAGFLMMALPGGSSSPRSFFFDEVRPIELGVAPLPTKNRKTDLLELLRVTTLLDDDDGGGGGPRGSSSSSSSSGGGRGATTACLSAVNRPSSEL